MRQSVGVWGTKWLIKLLYPRATELFDPCAKAHDEGYHDLDWSSDDPTGEIDSVLLYCMLNKAGDDQGLISDAWLFYEVARRWAKMRKRLWKLGIRW